MVENTVTVILNIVTPVFTAPYNFSNAYFRVYRNIYIYILYILVTKEIYFNYKLQQYIKLINVINQVIGLLNLKDWIMFSVIGIATGTVAFLIDLCVKKLTFLKFDTVLHCILYRARIMRFSRGTSKRTELQTTFPSRIWFKFFSK